MRLSHLTTTLLLTLLSTAAQAKPPQNYFDYPDCTNACLTQEAETCFRARCWCNNNSPALDKIWDCVRAVCPRIEDQKQFGRAFTYTTAQFCR